MHKLDAGKALAGAYTGKWEHFGFDAEKEKIVLKSSRTEDVAARQPVRTVDRLAITGACVHTVAGNPFKVVFLEGYFVDEQGHLGDRFFEIDNQLTRMPGQGEGAFTFVSEFNPHDSYSLGLLPEDVVAGKHVTVRVVSMDGKAELEHISRVTTVSFRKAKGVVETVQFVSLKGSHRREF